MWKRRLHNAAKAVSEIVDRFRKAIDNNLYIFAVFIDFSKAFETMNHQILLIKQEKYGIRGVPLE